MKKLFNKDSNISLYSPKNTVLLLLYNNSIQNDKTNQFANFTDK